MNNLVIKALLILAVLTGSLQAQDFGTGRFGGGLGIGSLGATGDVSYHLSPGWSVRLLAGNARLDRSGTLARDGTDAEYDAALRLGGIGPVIDYHPFDNGWRLSWGALLSGYRADLRFTGDIVIEGQSYNEVDVTARLRTANTVLPKLAVGYLGAELFGTRLGVSLDAGVLYTGGFTTTLTDRSATPLEDSAFRRLRRDLSDEIGGQRFLPYVSAGLRMNF